MRCKTCTHWRKITEDNWLHPDGSIDWPGPYGECMLINEHSQNRLAWLWVEVVDEDLSLITQPAFSCKKWRGNELA